MRLTKVTLENFRAYRGRTEIPVEEGLTTLIGKNDAGKSTVLEALEIFFNGARPDGDDPWCGGDQRENKTVRIGCAFADLPDEVVIDADAKTNLRDEFLLNAAGELEIHKRFDCSKAKISATVAAVANHPTANGKDDLLSLTITQLKSRAREVGASLKGVNQTVSAELRAAIRNAVPGDEMAVREIEIDALEGKRLLPAVEKLLPTFALFRADRPSKDSDGEVQDPMQVAVKSAIAGVREQLDGIKAAVEREVREVAEKTIEKLRELSPDLASALKPEFSAEPKWEGFKMALRDGNGVPVNKRGSGARRLILLSFFRAQAERAAGGKEVIYAIEEPETSQHPDNQRALAEALRDLADGGSAQVLVTTHNPAFARLMPARSVRLVELDGARCATVRSGDEAAKGAVVALGALKDHPVKVIVCLEGQNDIAFLQAVAATLRGAGRDVPDLASDERVLMHVLGGSNLGAFAEDWRLRRLGIPEAHLYDRDTTGPEQEPKYGEAAEKVNNRGDGSFARITAKREIENYLHPDAISDALGVTITFGEWDDVGEIVARNVHEAEPGGDWDALDDKKRRAKVSSAKKRLCRDAAAKMTTERLRERDPGGELEAWLVKVGELAGGPQPPAARGRAGGA